jgi:predicted enzyme related to lactoylglutathione lyase
MSSSIKFAFVVARDVDRMRDFYAQALELPVRFQDGHKWCQLDAGRADVALGGSAEAHPIAQGTVVVYQVSDLEAAKGRVLAAGGAILATREMGSHGSVATCTDVEANHFQLFASAPRRPA